MIHGIGIDIVEVARIARAIERWGNHFLNHVYCEEEIEYAFRHRYPFQHFAGRFAAKEAVIKAISNNPHIQWKNIKILNDKNGKPVCDYQDKKFKYPILISISHTSTHATACAIIAS